MAYTGQELTNPITHERFTFVETTQDTKGARLVFETRVTPGGVNIPAHIHTSQEERFEVSSGSLGVMRAGEKQILGPGDTIRLPARIKHQWWNAGEDEVRFRVEVAPARNLEAVIEALSGMAQEGKLNRRAMPTNPFRLAQLATFSDTYLAGIPLWLQGPLLALGSALGRLLGYDPAFTEYRTAAVTPSERVAA
jgi:quercetin dioxygenase-like cupin family protein